MKSKSLAFALIFLIGFSSCATRYVHASKDKKPKPIALVDKKKSKKHSKFR